MTSYFVEDSEGKVVLKALGAACYYQYNFNQKPLDNLVVKTIVPKDDANGITDEVIKEFVVDLTVMGFPMYMSEIKHNKELRPLVIMYEKDYRSKPYIRSALDYLRLLWEGKTVVKAYFRLKKKFPTENLFILLQAASILKRGMGGHAPPSSMQGIVSDMKSIRKWAKDHPKDKTTGSYALWKLVDGKDSAAGYDLEAFIEKSKFKNKLKEFKKALVLKKKVNKIAIKK